MAEYVAKMNDFLPALINVLAFQEVYTKAFESEFVEFKKGNIPLGYTGEFIHINPAEMDDYTRPVAPAYTDPFAAKNPVVFTDFLTVNNDKIASAILSEDYLADAFSSYEKLYEMGQQIVSSLYSGNAIWELNIILATALSGFGSGVRTPQTMAMPTTFDGALQVINQIKNTSSSFKRPGSNFVSAKFPNAISFTYPENQIILIKDELKNFLETYSYAFAKNEDRLEFIPRMIGTPEIGQINGQEVLAIVMDKAALQFRDKLFRVDSIYNPADGSLNYWLRRRAMTGFVGFANAVAFVAPATRSK